MAPKVVVITGASAGIGEAAARRLAADGHRLVLVGRSPERTRAVAADLGADHFVADFASLAQVRRLAADLLERYPRIDVLANNAGLTVSRRTVTEDGHELTLQVNHLAPFLLTDLLLPTLLASRATVIATSSAAHYGGRIDLADLDHTAGRYRMMRAYGDSKLAQVLHTRELHRRYGPQGLASAAYHPGVIASRFATTERGPVSWVYRWPLAKLLFSSPDTGADTLVFLAEATAGADFPSGQYFYRRRAVRPNPQADDRALAAAFWERSLTMVG